MEGTVKDRIVRIALATGIALRAWEFFGSPSLTFDEINLVRNVAQRTWVGLLHPLDYGQVAPPGFLLLERFFWSLFGTDWSLRLVPFVAGIAALFCFSMLARRVLRGVAVPLAVVLFALGEPFIKWGAQAKQYGVGICLAIVLLLVTVHLLGSSEDNRTRRAVAAGAVGFVAAWCSMGALLTIGGVGAALLVLAVCRRLPGARRIILLTLVPWFAGAFASGILRLRSVSPTTLEFMHASWSSRFAPWTLSPASLLWYWRSFHDLFNNYLGGAGSWPFVAWGLALLALGGFWVLWRHDVAILGVIIGPLVAAFGAAILHLYPFAARLVVFLIPVVIIAASAGAGYIVVRLGDARALSAAVIAAVLAPAVIHVCVHPPVYQTQRPRQQMAWLAQHRRPGDVLLVSYWAIPAFEWYGPRYGLTAEPVRLGGCWLTQPRNFLRDIEGLKGTPRAWIVMAQGRQAEEQLMLAYANTIGRRLESAWFDIGAMDAIYDFSDPALWGRASAATYPVNLPGHPDFYLMSCKTLFKH